MNGGRPNRGFQEGDGKRAARKACVVDLDGTIADERHRRWLATEEGRINWRKYFRSELVELDEPVDEARRVLMRIRARGVKIVYLSSRERPMLSATREWLEKHGFPAGELILRKPHESTIPFKEENIRRLQDRYDVLFGIGDREKDIAVYEHCGIESFLVGGASEEWWKGIGKKIEEFLG